jgi:hypothetical protein
MISPSLLPLLLLLLLFITSLTTTYAVVYDPKGVAGGNAQWTLGQTYSPITITPNDSIQFMWQGTHTVNLINSTCDCPCSGTLLSSSSPFTFSAQGTEPGQNLTLYCSVDSHCQLGYVVILLHCNSNIPYFKTNTFSKT